MFNTIALENLMSDLRLMDISNSPIPPFATGVLRHALCVNCESIDTPITTYYVFQILLYDYLTRLIQMGIQKIEVENKYLHLFSDRFM